MRRFAIITFTVSTVFFAHASDTLSFLIMTGMMMDDRGNFYETADYRSDLNNIPVLQLVEIESDDSNIAHLFFVRDDEVQREEVTFEIISEVYVDGVHLVFNSRHYGEISLVWADLFEMKEGYMVAMMLMRFQFGGNAYTASGFATSPDAQRIDEFAEDLRLEIDDLKSAASD